MKESVKTNFIQKFCLITDFYKKWKFNEKDYSKTNVYKRKWWKFNDKNYSKTNVYKKKMMKV